MTLSKTVRRVPILAGGILLLLAGMWGGLLRMGWPWPEIGTGAVTNHGALMIGGFLGTVISLERSVALGRLWTYGAPIFAALGGISLLVGLPPVAGQWLMLIGSLFLVAVFASIIFRQPTMFIFTMSLGAIAWAVGNALWLWGRPVPYLVPWWIAFLVLTIIGERLELSRFLPALRGRHSGFAVVVGLYILGLILSIWWLGLGWFISGLAMPLMAVWLLIHDLARRTILQKGLARFVAFCLLTGYFWMAVSGLLAVFYVLILPMIQGTAAGWLVTAPVVGLHYDSILHAVLLGFVFGMIFGHAPIIFPAVLNMQMDYSPRFYLHILMLESAVAWRIIADVGGWWGGREWAGLLAALAIVLFLIQTITSLSRRPAQPKAPPRKRSDGRSISLAVAMQPEG